jgi:hypothetical protein
MSTEDFAALVEGASQDQVLQMSWLVPQKFLDLPLRLLLAKGIGVPAGAGAATVSLALMQLLYPTSPEGVQQFQADIGVKPTGDLTAGQYSELGRRVTRQRDTPVYAYGDAKIDVLEPLAIVDGTWVGEGDELAWPINTAEITCDRDRSECLAVEARVDVPPIDDIDRGTGDSYTLYVHSDTYQIISWEPGEIVARKTDSCTTALLTLNRNSNEVHEVTSNNDTPRCSHLTPKLSKPMITRLVSGLEPTQAHWRKRAEITSTYLNPRVTKEMKEAFRGQAKQ